MFQSDKKFCEAYVSTDYYGSTDVSVSVSHILSNSSNKLQKDCWIVTPDQMNIAYDVIGSRSSEPIENRLYPATLWYANLYS